MSRDWTPREAYLLEQHEMKNGGTSLFESMRSTMVSYKGKTWPRYSEEEMSIREQFPVLGRFLGSFSKLYERLSRYENGVEFLRLKDAELAEYLAAGKYNPDSYLTKWFEGELDDRFYYREHNDELLIKNLCEEAAVHSCEQHYHYEAYKQDWYKEHGISKEDIARMMDQYLNDVKNGLFEGSFQSYELEFGYHGGQIYVCFDEFLDCDFSLRRVREEPSLDKVLNLAEGRSVETVDNAQCAVKCDIEKDSL